MEHMLNGNGNSAAKPANGETKTETFLSIINQLSSFKSLKFPYMLPIYQHVSYMFYIYIYNVGAQLAAWYSILATFSLLIQFHDVWGGLYCGKFFSDFVFSFLLMHVVFF